jgi:hypothetical protein
LKPVNILERQYSDLKAAARCETLECLRDKPAVELAKAAQKTYKLVYARPGAFYGFGDFYYGPSVDNDTIQGLPSREFAAGRFWPVSCTSMQLLTL